MDILKRKFSVSDVKAVVTKRTTKLTNDIADKDAEIATLQDTITELELLKDIETPKKDDKEEPAPSAELYDALFPSEEK